MELIKELNNRVESVQDSLAEEDFSALMASNDSNLRYLTGNGTGVLLTSAEEKILWVKKLYLEHHTQLYFHKNFPFEVREYDKNEVIQYVKENYSSSQLAVEDVSVKSYRSMAEKLGFKPQVTDFLLQQRMIKTSHEIEILKKAASMASSAMGKAQEVVEEGVRELDAAAEVESFIRENGSEAPPFEAGILLSSGKDAADIHAIPKDKKIREPSLVITDLGVKHKGYFSDMTRTFSIGRIRGKEEKTRNFVEDLKNDLISHLEVGMTAGEVHARAEEKINGFGHQFYHSTGHGVGLDIHEKPSLSPDNDTVLKENMVFTIEPGVYVPGNFGCRFEDMVLLTKKGPEVLTE